MERAGTYAENRYQRGLKRWRQRSLRWLLPRLLLLDAAIVVLAAYVGGETVWFMAGGVVGATAMGILLVWDLPEEAVLNWGRGAKAERLTEAALEPLMTEGWRAKHELKLKWGNIDHLVTGPAGTFLLETKAPRGQVRVENGEPLSRPYDDPEPPRRWTGLQRQLEYQLREIRFGRVPGVRPVRNVQPVVVIWGDFEQTLHEGGGIVYVHGKELTNWLRSCVESRPQLRF